MLYSEIIKRPIITEKTMKLVQNSNKYTFEVVAQATKPEVKEAIEALFSVKVLKVNIINEVAKERRVGKYSGLRPAVTKAIVTLDKESKIEIYNS